MTNDHRKPSKDDKRQNLLEHYQEAKLVRKIVAIISIVVFLLIIVVGGGGYLYINSALKPIDKNSKVYKKVDIPIGSSVTGIGDKLERNGIIKNTKVFKYYVKLKNEGGFMAGAYELSPSMSVQEIVNRLKTGKVLKKASFKIIIPEGKQLVEIAQIMAKATKQPDSAILTALNDKAFVKSMIAKYPDLLSNDILNPSIKYPLEGYLFPATYSFYKPNPSVEEVVTAMLSKTESVLGDYQGGDKGSKLTTHQLLTMASLIEEEATEKADRKGIASVFYNRINKGMPLQTDPTVLYAEGKHKEKVLYADLKVNSPYNTYIYKGLPPGPISNAGTMSIDAALNPEKTKYYYFLAAPDGSVLFSKTLEEHNSKKAKYISGKN
jgi:UPF0755 protein